MGILAGFLFILSPFNGHAGEKKLPFSVGEHLRYSVRWEMIPAGKAEFKVLPFTQIKGQKAYHFVLDVSSNRFVDVLYKIRGRLEGFADTGVKQSLYYRDTQTGKKKRTARIRFNWEKKTVVYSNFNKKRDPVRIPPETIDPVTAFYKLRTIDLKTGHSLSFPVTDGKRQFLQKGEVIKKETIHLSSGTYETFLLLPHVTHFSGVFKKSENPTVKLWISTDEKQIPVRIKVKVFIGSFIFDLVEIR